MNRLVESSIAPLPADRLRPLRYALRVPQLLLHATIAVPMSVLALNPLAARVAVSEDALRTARDGISGEFTVLFNGIDVERFANAKPWPTEGPTVLFFGRHEERKGLRVLLEAASALPEDVAIWIVGQGRDRARPSAHQEVALPVAGDGALIDLGRALGDHHHPGELALALAL